MFSKEVDLLVESCPVEIKKICNTLRELILSVSPEIDEWIKYNIPFYTYKGLLCYINPKGSFINFGFCKGSMLSNISGILNKCGKEVSLVKISSLSDINKDIFIILLNEAMLLNEIEFKKRKSKKTI